MVFIPKVQVKKEQQINEAKTIEEVEAVDIEFNDENTEDKA